MQYAVGYLTDAILPLGGMTMTMSAYAAVTRGDVIKVLVRIAK